MKDVRVIFGVTGGIAAYKAVEAARGLVRAGAVVDVVMTGAATRFVGPLTFSSVTSRPVWTGLFDGQHEGRISHIELTAKAGLFVVAPATANIIGKAANGIADDLLSTMLLAARCPILFVPAMNCRMYENPAVQKNLDTLRGMGVFFVGPDEGEMACGEYGYGRMSEPDEIVRAAMGLAGQHAGRRGVLSGKKVLITAGPTYEDIDPVRFIGNRSSGKMGYALAREALARGAIVTLVSGPVGTKPPVSARFKGVRSAREMRDAVMEYEGEADVIIMAAAVADYRPSAFSSAKIKKTEPELSLSLVRTDDILGALGKGRRPGQMLVGFAAETGDLDANAMKKLTEKGLDLIAANPVGGETGFETDDNDLYIYGPGGLVLNTGRVSKDDAARALFDVIAKKLPVNA